MGEQDGPLVSVVIPTYNRYDRLKRAVESVVDQTYDRIELLVVDDRSDVTVEEHLSRDYGRHFERFEIRRHDENRGGSAARNTGLREANGDYIALLDDDDQWKPQKLERQVERFQEEDVGLVTTGGKVIDGNGNVDNVRRDKDIPGEAPALTKRLLCRNIVGSCSAVMVDTDVVDEVGMFDERFPSWQDLEWYIRLSRHCRFSSVSEPLLIYSRDVDDRISEDLDTTKTETYPLFLKKFRHVAAEYGPVFERKMQAWTAFRVGKQLVLDDRVREGREFLTRSVRLYPFEAAFFKYFLPTLGGRQTYEFVRQTKRTISLWE